MRPFAGDGVRVTVGETEANDLFLGVGAGWLARALGVSVRLTWPVDVAPPLER